jgi:hypothetical protein
MIDLEPTQPFALWLLPAEPWANRLERTIADLARRHGTRAFLPHVTLCSAQGAKDASALEALASRWRPQQLTVAGLHWGDDAFTWLYLRLLPSPGTDLIGEAQQAFANSHPPAIGLHLSLLYGIPAPGAPGVAINHPALAAELSSKVVPQLELGDNHNGIPCDRLALVQPGAGGWAEGWPWRLAATHPLIGHS